MKKYFLILVVGFLFLMPSVNATEITCSSSINLLKPSNFIAGLYKPFDYSPSSVGYISVSYNSLIPVEPSTNYHYQHDASITHSTPMRVAISFYDSNFNYLSYTNIKVALTSYSYTFTTLENAFYITLHLYNVNIDSLNSNSYQLEKGSTFTEFVDYEECVIKEPDPVVPDSTLDNFYSIYLDKLGMLSSYAIENKFLFSFIGIIILFIVLEFFLILFKGWRRF